MITPQRTDGLLFRPENLGLARRTKTEGSIANNSPYQARLDLRLFHFFAHVLQEVPVRSVVSRYIW